MAHAVQSAYEKQWIKMRACGKSEMCDAQRKSIALRLVLGSPRMVNGEEVGSCRSLIESLWLPALCSRPCATESYRRLDLPRCSARVARVVAREVGK